VKLTGPEDNDYNVFFYFQLVFIVFRFHGMDFHLHYTKLYFHI